MNGLRCVQALAMVLLMGCSMSGCSRGIFNTEPFVDAKKDEHGNVVLRDTPRMWADFRENVDREVAKERNGDPAQGRISWNDFWLRRLAHIESGAQENAPKYIAYIIESRRRAGLPEIEGYPPPASD
jgi:hypothetical protein